jgi:hypothetical protein
MNRSRMWITVIASLLLFAAASAFADCVPGAGQAAFFKDDNFHGMCVTKSIGNYPTSTSTGLPNDSITSIRLGSGVQVFACRDEYYGGTCVLITASNPNVGSTPVGNDQITSFKVQSTGTATTCTPGPNQVSFFRDWNFTGGCETRGLGSYPTAVSIGLDNDSISSIRVGLGAQVFVCRDQYYGGTCELITTSAANLGSGHAVGNDSISSAKVQTAGSSTNCTPATNQVAFFRDVNFAGPCEVRSIGAYATSDAIGLPNDSISSFRVGSAAQVIVCKDVNFGGDCQLFKTSLSSMSGQRIANDSISSARIESLGTQDCAPGTEQVAFFMHANYVQPCSIRGLGTYTDSNAIGLPNDSMSSVLIGSGAQAILCVDVNFGKDCKRFTANTPNLPSGIGDEVSSAKVMHAGEVECQPSATQVSFYKHADFIAPCSVRDFGDYPTASSMGIDNDSLSSLRVGSGAQAVLCVDVNYGNDCVKFTASVASMTGTGIGNDETTSARVEPLGTVECPPAPNQVTLYQHANFLAPCSTKGVGDYPNAAAFGLPDNSISSVRVGSTVQACLCEAENFGNVCEAFTSDDNGLGNNFPSLGGGNDIVSSVKVQQPGALCKATPPAATGFSQVEISNCDSNQLAVHIWMRDLTINSSYQEKGTAPSNWSNGSCPSGAPFVVKLVNGHLMQLVAVDTTLPACSGNDPNSSACQKTLWPAVQGLDTGVSLPLQVD